MKYLPAALLLVSTSVVVHAADTDWNRPADLSDIARSMTAIKTAAAEAGATPKRVAALSGDDLPTPEERAKYKQLLSTNKAEAEIYLITRDFLRKCDAVLADHSKAISLPDQPAKVSERYLTAAERARVDEAVDYNIAAVLNAGGVKL